MPRDPALLTAELGADALDELDALLAALAKSLDTFRIVASRLHVVAPMRARVAAQLLLARRADVLDADLERAVVTALRAFLDPLTGGEDGQGWPFGRHVYVSEVVQLLEALPEVDHVPYAGLASECVPEISLCVEAPPEWNDDGDLVGLVLEPHHLPVIRPLDDTGRAPTSPSSASPVRAYVTVDRGHRSRRDRRSDALRSVKDALRELLQPPLLDTAFPPDPSDRRRTIVSDQLRSTRQAC